MDSNKALVEHLIATGRVVSENLINAFYSVDRALFVPKNRWSERYGDYPLPVGEGQTISQPTTVAIMQELLAPKEGDRVLDIGSGSGYTTALLAKAVGESGSVLGLDRIASLVALGKSNINTLEIENAKIQQAGKSLGRPDEKFDKILVSASAKSYPKELEIQLKNGGRMVIPVENSIWAISKDNTGQVTKEEHFGFVFVPLVY